MSGSGSMRAAKPTILVIGAGLGGLALAQGLVRAGFDVKVCERDQGPTSRAQGYRISMRPLGMAALAQLLPPGMVQRLSLAKVADVGDGFIFANEKMEPLLRIAPGQGAAVQLLRSELRTLLLEGLDVQWNKRLVKVDEEGERVVAHFADGSWLTADFLVGCDGGASTVRRLLAATPHARHASVPHVVGIDEVVLAGQIDRSPQWEQWLPLNRSGMVRFLGPATGYIGVCFSERADRSPAVFWGLTEKTDHRSATALQYDGGPESRKRLLDHCRELMKHGPWHPTLQKLVCETPLEGMMAPWLLRTTQFPAAPHALPMLPSGRVTLLGDAVHAMPPGQGLGGSHVLEDARLLTALLSAAPPPIDWPRLTGEYERQMFARTAPVVQESNNTAAMHQRIRSMPPPGTKEK